MATLQDIRRRIRSVQSTQKITRAMKLVAAAKLRRAQERILAARPYSDKMDAVLASLALRAERSAHPLLVQRAGNRKVLVVITGDRGLCGAFNSNILRRSLEWLRQQGDAEVALTLVVVGRKAREFYRRRPVTVRATYANFFDRLAYEHGAEIGQELVRAYAGEEADEVQLCYNEFKSAVSQRVTVVKLLPIEPLAVPEGEAAVDFLYEPSAAVILDRLLPKHIEVQIYRALLESLAAEYGARMTAMDNATRNAAEMIDVLTIAFNKARQERITKELLEVVSGAEALRATG
ncbi:MAG TPA: ATP synthase F1 subunit gamma [Candidatus Methylomirabilis sp.]|jgi:F-type H+-transporting ATPase subunit gamma|nr:ATP synthase F1 subunit gamma [Candidatus Methylomirabilis sp.]